MKIVPNVKNIDSEFNQTWYIKHSINKHYERKCIFDIDELSSLLKESTHWVSYKGQIPNELNQFNIHL